MAANGYTTPAFLGYAKDSGANPNKTQAPISRNFLGSMAKQNHQEFVGMAMRPHLFTALEIFSQLVAPDDE